MPNLVAEKLYYRRAGITYSVSLYDSIFMPGKVITGNLRVQVGGVTRYAPLAVATSDHGSHLRVRPKGVTYAVLASQPPPDNMVVLYNNTDARTGFGANGANATANLISASYIQSIIRTTSPTVAVGGATTHPAEHSFYSGATGVTDDMNYATKTGLKTMWYMTGGAAHSHSHSIASHTHGSAGSNFGQAVRGFIPWMYGHKLYNGAVVPCSSTLSAGFLTYLSTYLGHVIGMSTSLTALTTQAKTSHNHGAVSAGVNSFDKTVTSDGGKWENNDYVCYSHYHDSISHTDSNGTVYSAYTGHRTYTANAPFAFDDYPAGSIGFFTNNVFPPGWAVYEGVFETIGMEDAKKTEIGQVLNHGHTDSYPAFAANGTYTSYGQDHGTYLNGDNDGSGYVHISNSHGHPAGSGSHGPGTTNTSPNTCRAPYVTLNIGVKL